MKLDHPNEPGKWSRLDAADGLALWRRDRSDPFPVTQFYLLAPPRQTEVLYDETQARARFAALSAPEATRAA
ncbi:hypothetical protein BZG35_10720 [Brevundimonas sp. LM2]|uniref:hypothetical protein n=1 Tax=Brevundimonas sp. LM2 TaxID=1938605 RepID=UPI000983EBEF|nr:hypothetical protein [Brevundimonas sp. LM2]AQR62063.1 hypothetical protein BZG35_10720 [Brevundimonas sp. LM2]